jgi:hypothetical protein
VYILLKEGRKNGQSRKRGGEEEEEIEAARCLRF